MTRGRFQTSRIEIVLFECGSLPSPSGKHICCNIRFFLGNRRLEQGSFLNRVTRRFPNQISPLKYVIKIILLCNQLSLLQVLDDHFILQHPSAFNLFQIQLSLIDDILNKRNKNRAIFLYPLILKGLGLSKRSRITDQTRQFGNRESLFGYGVEDFGFVASILCDGCAFICQDPGFRVGLNHMDHLRISIEGDKEGSVLLGFGGQTWLHGGLRDPYQARWHPQSEEFSKVSRGYFAFVRYLSLLCEDDEIRSNFSTLLLKR